MSQEYEPDGAPSKGRPEPSRSMTASTLTRRIPLWSALVVLAVVTAALVTALVAVRQSAVALGPAVRTAQRIKVNMTLCNHDVDRLDLNPRHAELDLEGVLRDEGARSADVTVDRRDCPRQG